MKLNRLFTQPEIDPLDQITYDKRRSVITNPDGSIVFEARDAEIPKGWSQLATDILVSKYFRRAGLATAPGRETSARQVFHRIIHSIRGWGESKGYFDSTADADTFEAELKHVLAHQLGAFNSPVWFNCGLWHEYGIEASGGNFAWNDDTGRVEEIINNYSRPQCSACFIQSVGDDLMSIFELVKTEAKIFKYGSGTGTNFSRLRSRWEKLSGGGTSSGLMSFLEVLDRGAGATKSGGTTRRAAKMVCLDMDHPEITDFINWKVREEEKARILIEHGNLPADFNGEAYHTVSGQNSNNSVRVTDEFMQAALQGKDWGLTSRTEPGRVLRQVNATELLDQICNAAWRCADPGVQFDSTINDWHTCPATDKINASNPCSEFMFLDDTACNLASINLTRFIDEQGEFDVDGFRHVVRLFIIAQEILVDFSSYPTAPIARNSHDYRPLGLGYANLGALLMQLGIPYDSPEGRAMCGAITALMTGHAYRVSAEMAAQVGPFAGYARNARPMLRVMRKHRDAVEHVSAEFCPTYLLDAARLAWDEAIELGEKVGYRNSQTSVLAPTGTIGLLMDCDTTGIEPDFALVKFKKLAGGGYFKIINHSVPAALRRLGYSSQEIHDILHYVVGSASFRGAPHIDEVALKSHGLSDEDLLKIEQSLRGVMELEHAFSPISLGEDLLARLGLAQQAGDPGFSVLRALGFSEAQIEEASVHICGRMTIEGAPHLREEHLPIFDCANRCGKIGRRFIAPMGHVRMMAAAQPFISGAISKTVNLPHEAAVEDIQQIYVEGWRLGLKAIALYRDGCKMSQPLSGRADKKKKAKQAAELFEEALSQAEHAAPETVTIKVPAPTRRRLPTRRHGFTIESKVGGHKVYLRTGEYEDGTLGEIFIDMHKEGAAFRSMINCFAIAVSKGLQYGVPLKEFVDTFTFTRFEPQGPSDHPNIKFATSVIDFIFRVVALEYLHDASYCQVKPEGNGDTTLSITDSAHEAESLGKNQPRPSARIESLRPEPAAAQNRPAAQPSGLESQMSGLMGDAPFCDVCGHITVRNGTCYKCLNCGNSMGCS